MLGSIIWFLRVVIYSIQFGGAEGTLVRLNLEAVFCLLSTYRVNKVSLASRWTTSRARGETRASRADKEFCSAGLAMLRTRGVLCLRSCVSSQQRVLQRRFGHAAYRLSTEVCSWTGDVISLHGALCIFVCMLVFLDVTGSFSSERPLGYAVAFLSTKSQYVWFFGFNMVTFSEGGFYFVISFTHLFSLFFRSVGRPIIIFDIGERSKSSNVDAIGEREKHKVDIPFVFLSQVELGISERLRPLPAQPLSVAGFLTRRI